MLSAERAMLREPRTRWPAHEMVRMPPLKPVAAGGLSGRPRCRIFPVGRLWVLQVEMPSAWLMSDGLVEPPPRLKFPTLAAAIAHAEWYGYDYSIITPSPIAPAADRNRRSRSGGRPLSCEPAPRRK
jgi:hypothetical protein